MEKFYDPSVSIFHQMRKLRFPKTWRHTPQSNFFKTIMVLAFLLPSVLGSALTTKWVTTSTNESIFIPVLVVPDSTYTVDWGDGTVENFTTDYPSHIYAVADTHTVVVTGWINRVFFNNNATIRTKIVSIESWGSHVWTTMEKAFWGCTNLEYDATDAPDLTFVSSMFSMFQDCAKLDGDLSSWDVSNVTSMRQMFMSATVFNGPLNDWDVSSVSDFFRMFFVASAFDQPLNNWDVSSATTTSGMFGASFFNSSLEGWDLSNCSNASFMFQNAVAFNQPLDSWGDSILNINNMSGMFSGAAVFNQPLGSWDVSSVFDFRFMFENTGAFNQPLNSWGIYNVSPGVNMREMFEMAAAFDQSLGSWDVSMVTDMSSMLRLNGMSLTSYDNTLIGWAALDSVQMNVTLAAQGQQYCAGADARDSLTMNYNWNIIDSGPETNAPVAVCIPNTYPAVFLDAAGDGTLAENALAFGASNDACSAVTETSPLTNFTCADVGFQPVFLTATDANGNFASVNCSVIIFDTISPVIGVCPADIIVAADPGACGATNVITGAPTVTDNCPGALPVLINGTTPPYQFLVGERGSLGGSNAGGLGGVFYDGTRQMIANIHAADGVVMENSTSVIVSRFNPAGDNLIRVDLITGIEEPVASLGGLLQGMSFNTAGNLLVTNEGLGRIQEIDLSDGSIISEITGFNRPIDVEEETPTTLLISEYNLGQIVRYDLTNSTMTVLSTGHAKPTDVLLDGVGGAYVAENNSIVSSVNLTTGVRSIVVNTGGGPFGPHGMALDGNGDLYITVFSSGEIKKWDGVSLTTFATGLSSPVFIVTAPENIFPVGINCVDWTAIDASGNTVSCTQKITVTGPNTCGNPAEVLDFDGVDDYVDLGAFDPYGVDGFTQEAWVYPQDIGEDNWSNSIILQEGPTVGPSNTSTILRIGQNGGHSVRASFHHGPDGVNDVYDLNGSVTVDNWNHLAMTWSPVKDSFFLYVNGVLAEKIFAPNPPNSSTGNVWLGNSERVQDRLFDGRMDEVRIWDHYRSQAQIQATMERKLNGGEAGLLAYYNFDQGQAFLDNTGETTLNDFNGNQNGTLNNFQLTIGDNSNWIEPGPSLSTAASTGFVTTWEVTAGDLNLSIPTTGGGYNYTVNWGDGIVDEGLKGTANHTYAFPGIYTVSIEGDFPWMPIAKRTVGLKLKSVEQWGDIVWQSMKFMFDGCQNMVYNATDAPNLTNVTDMEFMFRKCFSFNGDLSNWDMSNVQKVGLMFTWSGFNGNVSTWNTSNFTDMTQMFRVSQFDQDVSNWDVSNVVSMHSMFALCPFNQPLSNWERVGSTVGNVTVMSHLFSGNSKFNQNINNWDVSSCTNMQAMFGRDSAYNQPMNTWIVDNVTNMAEMFQDAVAFDQDLSSWNTGNVTTMHEMFAGNTGFSQDISMWDVGKVVSFQGMFNKTSAWDNSLAAWNITSANNMTAMLDFSGMSDANYDLTLIGWGAQDVINFVGVGSTGKQYCTGEDDRQHLIDEHGWIFPFDSRDAGCMGSPPPPAPDFTEFITTWETTTANESIIIPTRATPFRPWFPSYTYDYTVDWGDGTVESGFTDDATHEYATAGVHTVKITGTFPAIFFNNWYFPPLKENKNKIKSIENWGDIEWQTFYDAFSGCENLEYNATDVPDLDDVTSTYKMFYGCHEFDGNLSNWDMSNITNIGGMFNHAKNFNGDVSGWNTSNMIYMNGAFWGTSFNGSVENWDMTNVESADGLFALCPFNQPLSNWESTGSTMGNVKFMRRMFYRNEAFNQDINNWDMSGAENIYWMFEGAKSYNQPLDQWDVSNVIDMHRMFADADAFNQDISGWDVSNVNSMEQMFTSADVFNQNLSPWNTGKVWNMTSMFREAVAFDQSLAAWDISGIDEFYGFQENRGLRRFFENCGMSVANYDATLIGWAGQVDVDMYLRVGAIGMQFCASEQAREFIKSSKGWFFLGDAQDPSCAGACNCNPNISPLIPNTAAGLHTAAVKCEGDDFTHYCDNLGRILLSISNAEAATIDAADVNVNIVPGLNYYKQNCDDSGGTEEGTCFISNVDGATVLCRTWDVTSAESNASVRYYFDDMDFQIINEGNLGYGLSPLTELEQIWLYKVTSAGAGHEKPEDLNSGEVQLIHNDGTDTPTTTNWVLGGTALGNHYAEYMVSSFSGGGGGGGEKGASPTCPSIEATISGDTVLMAPGSSEVFVNITGGTGPYTLGLDDGTMVNNYNSGDAISVSATVTTNFNIASLSDANGCPFTIASGVGAIYIQDDQDGEAPAPLCQDVTVDLDASGQAMIDVFDIDAGSHDNDSIATMELNVTTFDCSADGSDIVTLTVTDASGNFEDCTAIVTINDPLNVCCPAVREVPNTPTDSKQYDASTQVISDAEVKLGDGNTNIIFEAGNNVHLSPGFEVQQGAVFEAKIGPCGSNN